jgi:hypothetical protein
MIPKSTTKTSIALGILAAALAAAAAGACGDEGPAGGSGPTGPTSGTTRQALRGRTATSTKTSTPIALAVDIENGAGVPISVRAGQTFYLNTVDIRASVNTTVDEGVAELSRSGDFASLEWDGLRLVDEAPILLANPDGTSTRRRFYRFADWMNDDGVLLVDQVDAHGRPTAPVVEYRTGREGRPEKSDDYWDRRYRALQWTNDCKTQTDCSGATSFQEEALVELRYLQHTDKTFQIKGDTAALRVRWSQQHGRAYTIPVTQVKDPAYDYGFSIDIAPLTPPNADGTYAPGTDVTFRATLRDGAGTALHPPGQMPSYDDVEFGPDPAGIQYYRAFFDPTMTYYRRKHRERNMIVSFLGPAQNAQPIRHLAPFPEFLAPPDVQDIADFADDGVYAQFKLFPTSHDLFGGVIDPTHAAWANPVSDTWTNHIPSDAVPGTYFVTMKGRRVYLGEDIFFTRTIEVQVGTAARTTATLDTGHCEDCHTGASSLSKILHGNDNRATCAACHTPLGFEYEGPIYVRLHFIHSRSTRFDEPLDRCADCHLSRESIQRTSQSACISCHRTYDDWHVKTYGPITYMYTGGTSTQFEQCTNACHTDHPNSGL